MTILTAIDKELKNGSRLQVYLFDQDSLCRMRILLDGTEEYDGPVKSIVRNHKARPGYPHSLVVELGPPYGRTVFTLTTEEADAFDTTYKQIARPYRDTRPNRPRSAVCECGCGQRLTSFDRDASAVPGFKFDCA